MMIGEAYAFGPFQLDVSSRQLRRDGEPVALSGKVLDTLIVLVRRRGAIVSKDELMATVWPDSFVSEDSLTQNISNVRRGLGDETGQPRFIATIPRQGYRFIAAVTDLSLPHPLPAADALAAAIAGSEVQEGPPSTAERSGGRGRRQWIVAAAVTTALAGAFVAGRIVAGPRWQPTGTPFRFTEESPPATTLLSGGVVSPDSRSLAFVARDARSGKTALWIRSLNSLDRRTLPGTEDASKPFWSPDSQRIGFFANGRLKSVGLGGEAPLTLETVGQNPAGGTWNTSGVILFAPWKSGLYSTTASGGSVKPVTALDASAQEVAHRAPQFLPDGRHFLYVVDSVNAERAGTYVGTIDAPDRVRILDGRSRAAIYADPGYVIQIREGAVLAQPFDRSRFQLTGDVITLGGKLSPATELSASAAGLLAFGPSTAGNRLVWFNRSGDRTGTIDSPAVLHSPTLFNNQTQLLAFSNETDEQKGVWLVDLERGGSTRVVPNANAGLLTPDDTRIVFTSDRLAGVTDLYIKSVTGGDEDQLLLRSAENKAVNDWSPDGKYLVYISTNRKTNKDLWLLPMFGDRRPIPFLQTVFDELQGEVSPDGHSMVYSSNETGAWEVYVQSFPVPGGKRVVSIGGGAEPQWRRDGKELFYLATDRTLMAVDVTPGPTPQFGRPRALFRVPVPGDLNTYRSHYAVTADGQRFLVDLLDEPANKDSITVVVNWHAAAKF